MNIDVQVETADVSLLPGYTFNPASLFESFPDVQLSNYGRTIIWQGRTYTPTDLPRLRLIAYHNTDSALVTAAAMAGWPIRQLLRPMCVVCGNDSDSGVFTPGDVLCHLCFADNFNHTPRPGNVWAKR